MKTLKLILSICILLAIAGLNDARGQWASSGTHIYNTNTGNVGIGNNSPSTLLFVAKNMSEPTITVRNLGGFGGATYTMMDDASGANWKFKATLSGGFKIRDHARGLDVFVIEQNTAANLIYLKSGGRVGIGTSTPDNSAIVDMTSTNKGFLLPRMTYAALLAIPDPADGLLVFCTDCGSSSSGALTMFLADSWHTLFFNDCLTQTSAPGEGNHVTATTQIIWNWTTSSNASGYKWNFTDDYETAEDMGANLTRTDTGLISNTPYIRYAWAYNECGNSAATMLTATTALEGSACGDSITINHVAGNVAPVSKTVTYGTVSNIPGENLKCWITSNLGADHQATSVNDNTEPSAGWYWQFNRKQGYKHDGTGRTPNITWPGDSADFTNWVTAKDPCNIELGTGWRVPTSTEWSNIDEAGAWTNWNQPYGSPLKLHAAGRLHYSTGNLEEKGYKGSYWSSTQYGIINWALMLNFRSSSCNISSFEKEYGYPVRCVKN